MTNNPRPCKVADCPKKSLYSWLPYCMAHWHESVEINLEAFIQAERTKKAN